MSISAFNTKAKKAFERTKERYSMEDVCFLTPEEHRQRLHDVMKKVGINIIPDEDYERRRQAPQGRPSIFDETQAVSCLPAA